jgi:uncharacterized 2Fe-2S/4Fe-4S cluster protein (DUF4445 family)
MLGKRKTISPQELQAKRPREHLLRGQMKVEGDVVVVVEEEAEEKRQQKLKHTPRGTRLQMAVREWQKDPMQTQKEVAERLQVAESSLCRTLKLVREGKEKQKVGRQAILTPDQSCELYLWVGECAKSGNPKTKDDILKKVRGVKRSASGP